MSQQPPPPPPAPPGYLRLRLQGSRALNLIAPSVQIDGYPVAATYGENVYPIPPGRHAVACHGQWMWRFGHAMQPFDVAPGQEVDIYYAAPAFVFLSGRIGFAKQKVAGSGVLLALAVLIVLVPVAAIIAVIAAT